MPIDAESLYVQLGRLIESMPDLNASPISAATQQWLGRAYALVNQLGDFGDTATLKISANNLHTDLTTNHPQLVATVLYRALAAAELNAPAAVRGAFIPAGNSFDAFVAVGKVLSTAKREVLIVDPYMDEKVLTDFAHLCAEKVLVRLLSDEKAHKSSLKPATSRWIAQYGSARPLEVRLAPARQLHDRLIVTDENDVWTLTQSLNAFAARSPATIVKIDSETSLLKTAAYAAMWSGAKTI